MCAARSSLQQREASFRPFSAHPCPCGFGEGNLAIDQGRAALLDGGAFASQACCELLQDRIQPSRPEIMPVRLLVATYVGSSVRPRGCLWEAAPKRRLRVGINRTSTGLDANMWLPPRFGRQRIFRSISWRQMRNCLPDRIGSSRARAVMRGSMASTTLCRSSDAAHTFSEQPERHVAPRAPARRARATGPRDGGCFCAAVGAARPGRLEPRRVTHSPRG